MRSKRKKGLIYAKRLILSALTLNMAHIPKIIAMLVIAVTAEVKPATTKAAPILTVAVS